MQEVKTRSHNSAATILSHLERLLVAVFFILLLPFVFEIFSASMPFRWIAAFFVIAIVKGRKSAPKKTPGAADASKPGGQLDHRARELGFFLAHATADQTHRLFKELDICPHDQKQYLTVLIELVILCAYLASRNLNDSYSPSTKERFSELLFSTLYNRLSRGFRYKGPDDERKFITLCSLRMSQYDDLHRREGGELALYRTLAEHIGHSLLLHGQEKKVTVLVHLLVPRILRNLNNTQECAA